MTSDEFFAICPNATWPDALSEAEWRAALEDITRIIEADRAKSANR